MTSLKTNLLSLKTGQAWKKIGIYPHHGINVALFSLLTEKSSGIGEFYDLILLIDWCKDLGLDIIQLLPLNESGEDPSPYNAISAYALHPIYLSLYALPYMETDPLATEKLKKFTPFSSSKKVPYNAILSAKMTFLINYYETFGAKVKREKSYAHFLNTHQEWLTEYALFKVLKNHHQDILWKSWPIKDRDITKNHMKSLSRKFHKKMEFHFFVQYLCFSQMKRVKQHAKGKGVFLMGDIPILINSESHDVWAHQDLFDLSMVAGSPPNKLYDPKGQRWDLPLYNWNAHDQTDYFWWKKRLKIAEEFFHMYRIDHIQGLFRIWAVPKNGDPSKGHFIPKDPALMDIQGRELLDALIQTTDMLPVGETMGTIPKFVKSCLKEYGICSLNIFRRAKYTEGNQSFIPSEKYPPLSLNSVSTHDIDTVCLWWKKKPEEAREYAAFKGFPYTKTLTKNQQLDILKEMHSSPSLFHINLLQEYLALTPHLTWDNPEDERINYPGTVGPLNWTYRYRMPLETLRADKTLNDYFKKILPKKRVNK